VRKKNPLRRNFILTFKVTRRKNNFGVKNQGVNVIATTITAAVIAMILGALGGYVMRKKTAEEKIGSAEEEAKRIVEEAREKGNTEKKEAVLEAKEEIHRLRQELDKDTKERRGELARLEKRVVQKEENLDRKMDSLEKKELRHFQKMKRETF